MNAVLRKQLVRFAAWGNQSVNRRIFAAMIVIAGLTALVRIAGAAREMVVAYQFGTGDAVDAFLIAFLLPSLAINIVAGSFASALVPAFISVREHDGPDAAKNLFSAALMRGLGLLVMAAFLLAIAAPVLLPLIGSGFSGAKLLLTQSLFYLLLPVIVLSGVSLIASSLLNACERFALAAIVPLATPLLGVVSLAVGGSRFGIYALAGGVLLGAAVETGLIMWSIRRLGVSLSFRSEAPPSQINQVAKQYWPMVAGALIMSGTELVNHAMAAMLGPGSVAALGYGNRLVAFLLGIGSLAIGTAVFPHFSRLAATADWPSLRHTLYTYVRLILLVSVPITLLIAFFSEPIVRILFERGAFDSSSTLVVSQVQAFFVLQTPFYLISILLVRLISALKANQVLMHGAMISLAINIALNYLLMNWLGVAGIALATAIVYVLSLGFLFFMLPRLQVALAYGRG